MSTKLIYRNPLLYDLLMRVLYHRNYDARSRAIADLIEPGASVLDLCCGSGLLYRRYLRAKQVHYLGLDNSRPFVDSLQNRGIRAMQWDLHSKTELPAADYVTMQSSLCYFLPDPAPVIDRMLQAAAKAVIVAEPIRNLSTSNSALVRQIAVTLSGPGGEHSQRFDERALDQFFQSYSARLRDRFTIPGGREKVYVLNGLRQGAGLPESRRSQ